MGVQVSLVTQNLLKGAKMKINSFEVNGLTIKKHSGNSDYFAQFDVYQGECQVAYMKFDDGLFTVTRHNSYSSYFVIYDSHIDYSDLAKEIRKATKKINDYLLEMFIKESL